MLHLQKQLRMEVFSCNIIIKQILIITSTFDIAIIVMTTSLNEMFLMSGVLSILSYLTLKCTWKTKLDHDQKDMFVVYCLFIIIISNGNYTNMNQDFYQ
jgi:hypothetical protein